MTFLDSRSFFQWLLKLLLVWNRTTTRVHRGSGSGMMMMTESHRNTVVVVALWWCCVRTAIKHRYNITTASDATQTIDLKHTIPITIYTYMSVCVCKVSSALYVQLVCCGVVVLQTKKRSVRSSKKESFRLIRIHDVTKGIKI